MHRILLVLFCTCAVVVGAWEWPVPVPVIEGTFGQWVDGTVLKGVEIGGGAQPVFPVEDGVVVISHPDHAPVPSPFGSYVVIEHEQSFRSIYAHLSAESLPPVGREVTTEQQIAVVGDSGHVSSRRLRLYLFDIRNSLFVNPLLLLPDISDGVAPTIADLFAESERGTFSLGTGEPSLPTGVYRLTARVFDRASRGRNAPMLAPYEIAVFVAGQEQFRLSADGISFEPDGLVLSPEGNRELFTGDGLWNLGSLTISPGRTEVEIVVTDFVGNEASTLVRIQGFVDDGAQP